MASAAGNNNNVPASGQIEASLLAARLNNNILTSTRLYNSRSQDQLPLGDVRSLATALGSANPSGSNGGPGRVQGNNATRGGSNGNVDLLVDFGGPQPSSSTAFNGWSTSAGIIGNDHHCSNVDARVLEPETTTQYGTGERGGGGGSARKGMRRTAGQSRSSDNILDNEQK